MCALSERVQVDQRDQRWHAPFIIKRQLNIRSHRTGNAQRTKSAQERNEFEWKFSNRQRGKCRSCTSRYSVRSLRGSVRSMRGGVRRMRCMRRVQRLQSMRNMLSLSGTRRVRGVHSRVPVCKWFLARSKGLWHARELWFHRGRLRVHHQRCRRKIRIKSMRCTNARALQFAGELRNRRAFFGWIRRPSA